MREIVKIRQVAGSLVISLPLPVLKRAGFKERDRVMLRSVRGCVLLTKEKT